MSKKSTTIITLSILLLALATPCIWLALVNRQKGLDKALFEAAKHGTGEDVKRAVEAGGRVEASDWDLEPIKLSIPLLENNDSICDMLGKMGIRVNRNDPFKSTWQPSPIGNHPMHLAASNPHVDALKTLIELGASVNSQDNWGAQPIHNAAADGSLEAIQYLLAAGAQVNATSNIGHQPLHEAANRQDVRILKFLLDTGAQVNTADLDGNQPIHVILKAWRNGSSKQKEPLTLLIAAGAKASAQTKDGKTPISMIENILGRHGLQQDDPEAWAFYSDILAYLTAQAAKELTRF